MSEKGVIVGGKIVRKSAVKPHKFLKSSMQLGLQVRFGGSSIEWFNIVGSEKIVNGWNETLKVGQIITFGHNEYRDIVGSSLRITEKAIEREVTDKLEIPDEDFISLYEKCIEEAIPLLEKKCRARGSYSNVEVLMVAGNLFIENVKERRFRIINKLKAGAG